MSITLGLNIASLQAQRRLGENSAGLTRVFERLSSGQRITHASDDAAGLAIADSLRADARVYTQGVRNLNDGISLTSIADGALTELSSIVTRVRELAEQAANGTFGSVQRKALDLEAQSLSKEYTRIVQTTSFNGVSLFNGSVSSIALQGGYGSAATLNASLGGAVGTGTLGASTSYVAELVSSNVVRLADLNSDGILDLVSNGSNGGSNSVTVRMGAADGTFQNSVSYATGTASDMQLADLNNDGQLDLVTLHSVAVEFRLGNADGSFGALASMNANPSSNSAVEAADFDGDGIMDLMVGGINAGIPQLTFHKGRGGGAFASAVLIQPGGGGPIGAIATADLNRDGVLDMMVGGPGGINIALLGNGNGTFKSPLTFAGTSVANQYIAQDLNGDGIIDLAVATGAGTGTTFINIGNGDGTFRSAGQYSETGGSSTTTSIAFGDLNGDGMVDMVTANSNSSIGNTNIRFGNGNGTFGAATSYASESQGSEFLALGDVNRDGVLDVVTVGTSAGGKATVRFSNTTSGVAGLLPFSLTTMAGARQSMALLDQSLSRISAQRGAIGAVQSRISAATANLQVTTENLISAESQIRDADVSQDAAELTRRSILQQASAAIMAQANQQPAIALQLLK